MVVPTPAGFIVLVRHYRAIQDAVEEGPVVGPSACPRIEPPVVRLARAIHLIDEEPIRALHIRGVRGDLDPEQDLVQFHQLVPDGNLPGGAFAVRFDRDTEPRKLVAGLVRPGHDLDQVASRSRNLDRDFHRCVTPQSEVVTVRAPAIIRRRQLLQLAARNDSTRGAAHVQPVEMDVAVNRIAPAPVVVGEGQSHGLGPRRQRSAQRERLLLGPGTGPDLERSFQLHTRPRREVNPGEQPPLRFGSEEEVPHHDRTAHLRRVSPGHTRHHRRDIPGTFRDSVGVDASVQKAVPTRQRIQRSA